MKPHKHAELIKAWADGAEIEYKSKFGGGWFLFDGEKDGWIEDYEYRIKPEPKLDVVKYGNVFIKQDGDSFDNFSIKFEGFFHRYSQLNCNLKLTFDGETGELKSAGVIK